MMGLVSLTAYFPTADLDIALNQREDFMDDC